MRERDYYRDNYDNDKYEYEKKDKRECGKKDKWEKGESSAYAGSKAIAINKNYNCLTLPSCGPAYEGPASYEEKRKEGSDPRDFDTVWKKGGYDREDYSRESEAIASGKAAIFNKNINFVYRGLFVR